MIETTPDKLHKKICAEPMTRVAAHYGISDVILKMIWVKIRIPTPPKL